MEFYTKMDSLEAKDTNIADVQQSIEDIKASYPDEWILLGNPEMNDREMAIHSGVVLYHSPDKRELRYRDKPLLKKYDQTLLFFNRVTPRPKRQVIASIFSTLRPIVNNDLSI